MKITKEEFKVLFGLEDNCKITADILRIYNKQIEGAYLLYREILKISDKKFKNIDGTELIADYEPFELGFQRFITTYGSKNKFHVSYIDEKRGEPVPFWTYTKYETDEAVKMKNSAYRIFISNILGKLQYKYSKYHIYFEFRDYSRNYPNHSNNAIWWDSVEFYPLFYFDSDGHPAELTSREIQETICNRSGHIYNGDIRKPIRRIMDKIDEKK